MSRSSTWSVEADYPFSDPEEPFIHSFSIIDLETSFYMFGGWIMDRTSDIDASFDTKSRQWKKLGHLNQARYGNGVINQQGQFIVVGGNSYSEKLRITERCYLENESIQCTTIEPVLDVYYPELMLVPEDYCPK